MPYVIDQSTGQEQFVDKRQLGGTQASMQMGADSSSDTLGNIKSLVGQEILKQPNLKISDVKTAFEFMEGTPLSAEEKKRQYSRGDAIRAIEALEAAYFMGPNGPLAYGSRGGFQGRLEGLGEELQAKFSADYNPYLKSYLANLESIRPTMARIAGDVGNLSEGEQKKAVAQIPTGKESIAEATTQFNELRKRIGIEPKNYTPILQSQGITRTTKGNGDVIDFDFGAVNKTYDKKYGKVSSQAQTTTGDTATDLVSGNVDISKLSTMQRLLGTTEESVTPNLPGAKYGGEVGALAGTKIPLPPGLRTLLGGAVGQTYENIGKEGIPLTRGEVEKRIGGSPLNPLNTAKYSINQMKPVIPMAAADFLLGGGGILKRGRDFVAQQYGKIPTQQIAEGATKYASEAPEAVRGAARKLLPETVQTYGGEKTMTMPELLKKATEAQNIAFNLSGSPSRAGSSKYMNVVAENLRELIKQKSPAAGYLTSAMSTIIKSKNSAKNLLKILGPSLALYAGTRFIGSRMPE